MHRAGQALVCLPSASPVPMVPSFKMLGTDTAFPFLSHFTEKLLPHFPLLRRDRLLRVPYAPVAMAAKFRPPSMLFLP